MGGCLILMCLECHGSCIDGVALVIEANLVALRLNLWPENNQSLLAIANMYSIYVAIITNILSLLASTLKTCGVQRQRTTVW